MVFAVKNRDAVLNKKIRNRVFAYMSGIITEMKHKSIIIGGISNHTHILIGLNPNMSISDTVHDIKRNTTLFINREKLCLGTFAWQESYGAFTYSKSQLDQVYKYILNQEQHLAKMTFQDEYLLFLKNYEIEYDVRFLFDFLEDNNT
jgi:REP element-mobilizing transposase RayT